MFCRIGYQGILVGSCSPKFLCYCLFPQRCFLPIIVLLSVLGLQGCLYLFSVLPPSLGMTLLCLHEAWCCLLCCCTIWNLMLCCVGQLSAEFTFVCNSKFLSLWWCKVGSFLKSTFVSTGLGLALLLSLAASLSGKLGRRRQSPPPPPLRTPVRPSCPLPYCLLGQFSFTGSTWKVLYLMQSF